MKKIITSPKKTDSFEERQNCRKNNKSDTVESRKDSNIAI